MYSLAVLYHKGEKGMAEDPAQALNWYRKAADRGEPSAMNNIAIMYEDGEGGLPTDSSQAAKWYEAAAALNLSTAKRNLERIRRERRATDTPSG